MKQVLIVVSAFAFAIAMALLVHHGTLPFGAVFGIAAIVWVAVMVFTPQRRKHEDS